MNRIFITGGASGLGRAIALRYAREGWRVAIGDLDDVAAEQATIEIARSAGDAVQFHCDVTKEEDLQAVATALTERWGGVDVVVNNAGVAQAGAIEDVPLDDWKWILDVNLLGVVRGCRVFTPIFVTQQRGHFVNIASMAGLLDVPLMSSYNASKAAVVSLSETLQHELGDRGINVTVVCPSFFRTNIGTSMRTTDPRLRTVMERLLDKSPITAEDIADQVFHAVNRKEFYLLPHAQGRKVWTMKRLLPRAVYARLMERQTRLLRGKK